jgi:hypothetical protein
VPPPSPGAPAAPGHAALIEKLLRSDHDSDLLRQALRRRHDARIAYGVLLVFGPDTDVAALGRAITGRVPRAVPITLLDASPPHAAVVVPAPTPGVWEYAVHVAAAEAGAREGLVLPRRPVLGLRSLRASYFRAVADAEMILRLDPPGPLITPRELVVPRMLAALESADQDTLLEPLRPILDLPAAHRLGYIRTLDALHHNGGTQAGAAAALHLHPNTVRYRMDRIEEMTGLHLDDPRHRLLLDLGAILVLLRGYPADLNADLGFDIMNLEPGTYCLEDSRDPFRDPALRAQVRAEPPRQRRRLRRTSPATAA